jgi:uncharacterized membrane protein YqiK
MDGNGRAWPKAKDASSNGNHVSTGIIVVIVVVIAVIVAIFFSTILIYKPRTNSC